METKYLDAKCMYMNPNTGSVDLGENWERDFNEQDDIIKWDMWGGNNLIEVVFMNGEWKEI